MAAAQWHHHVSGLQNGLTKLQRCVAAGKLAKCMLLLQLCIRASSPGPRIMAVSIAYRLQEPVNHAAAKGPRSSSILNAVIRRWQNPWGTA